MKKITLKIKDGKVDAVFTNLYDEMAYYKKECEQALEECKKAQHERDVYKELLSGSSGAKKFTSRQIAIIAYALCRKGEFIPKNKKNIAPLFHDLTGYSENTIWQNLCTSYKDEEIEEIATAVEKCMPEFAKYLREKTFFLPEQTK